MIQQRSLHLEQEVQEESQISELTIMPDGRVYAFGTTRKVLEILQSLDPRDEALQRILTRVRDLEQGA
jgi:hypothetical protein